MNIDSRAFQYLAWVGIALLTAAGFYLAVVGKWSGAGAMAGFALGSAALVLGRRRLPTLFSFLFVLAALANAAGWVWNLFQNRKLVWYDEVVHGFTMCTIGLVIAFWIHYACTQRQEAAQRRTRPGAAFIGSVIGTAFLVGGAWELVEWAFNIIGPAWDTFTDLVADTIGGLIAGAFAAWLIRSSPPQQLRD